MILLVSLFINERLLFKLNQKFKVTVRLHPNYVLSKNLGIKNNLGLENLVRKLEDLMDQTYMQHVKDRVFKGGVIHHDDYDWYLLELKPFLSCRAF